MHETRIKSDFQLNIENLSFNNSLHSSLFMSSNRWCFNINYWRKDRSRFFHASIYLSLSWVYHAITKCRNDCIKKKIYCSKTCIFIKNEIKFIDFMFRCIILFYFVDLKNYFFNNKNFWFFIIQKSKMIKSRDCSSKTKNRRRTIENVKMNHHIITKMKKRKMNHHINTKMKRIIAKK